MSARRAPVQSQERRGKWAKPNGTVAWWEHEEAFAAYAERYGNSQTAEDMARRAGFGYWEMTDLLGHEPTTWSDA